MNYITATAQYEQKSESLNQQYKSGRQANNDENRQQDKRQGNDDPNCDREVENPSTFPIYDEGPDQARKVQLICLRLQQIKPNTKLGTENTGFLITVVSVFPNLASKLNFLSLHSSRSQRHNFVEASFFDFFGNGPRDSAAHWFSVFLDQNACIIIKLDY